MQKSASPTAAPQRAEKLHQTEVTTSSPVPPAELPQGYNAAFEKWASRLFALIESQSAHCQNLENNVVKAQLEHRKQGQLFAFIIAIVFGVFGLILAFMGHPVVAGTVFSTTVGALVIAFITNQSSQRKSLRKKSAALGNAERHTGARLCGTTRSPRP